LGFINKSKEDLIKESLDNGYSESFLESTDPVSGLKMKEVVKNEITRDWDEHMCWKIETLTSQARASQTHFVGRKRLRALKESGVPITVQISTADKLVKPRQQWALARYLHADTMVFKGAGHIGAREHWDKWTSGLLNHLVTASSSSKN